MYVTSDGAAEQEPVSALSVRVQASMNTQAFLFYVVRIDLMCSEDTFKIFSYLLEASIVR